MKQRTLPGAGFAAVFLWGYRRSRLDSGLLNSSQVQDLASDSGGTCCPEPDQSDGAGRIDYAPLFEPGLYRSAACGQPLWGRLSPTLAEGRERCPRRR